MMWGYGPHWGMGPWDSYGGGPIGMFAGIIGLALVIAGVVSFVRASTRPGHQLAGFGRRSPGLDALEERYARGEIKREEYLEKKSDLTA